MNLPLGFRHFLGHLGSEPLPLADSAGEGIAASLAFLDRRPSTASSCRPVSATRFRVGWWPLPALYRGRFPPPPELSPRPP
jgi:hypothetical protein